MSKKNAENSELRDHAATAAMQGLVAAGSTNVDGTATSAVAYADALVKALYPDDVEVPPEPEPRRG